MNITTPSITVAYLRTSALDLCYSDAQLQALVDRLAVETPVAVLLSIPGRDAIRVLCSEAQDLRAALARELNAITQDEEQEPGPEEG